jgi:hypothetical protein
MWMSPDPAAVFFREVYAPLMWRDFIEKDILQRLNGEAVLLKHSFRASAQFANPYTYGGDPINLNDPTGLWAVGLGLVVGWDKNRGWNYGFGIAASFGNENEYGINASYTWHQDGSNTFSLNASASFQYYFLNFGGNFGYSYNTYSGHSVSMSGHACLGKEGICAGIEAGGSLYWDPYGNYLGATAFAGAFAELSIGDFNAKVNAGYEIGLMGMEGRGLYAGANAGTNGASLYASWAENGGFNYGGGYRFANLKYNSETTDYLNLSVFGLDFTLLERMAIIDGFPNFVRNRGYKKMLKTLDDNNNNDFIVGGHGVYDKIANKFVGLIDIMGNQYDEYALKEWLYKNGYKDGQNIILMSCGNAILAERLSSIMPGAFVTGASTSVIHNTFTGRVHLEDSGSWQTYQNGKLVGSVRDGFWD